MTVKPKITKNESVIKPHDIKRGDVIWSSKKQDYMYVVSKRRNRNGRAVVRGMFARDFESSKRQFYTVTYRGVDIVTRAGTVTEGVLSKVENVIVEVGEANYAYAMKNYEKVNPDINNDITLVDGTRAKLGDLVVVQFRNGQYTCELGNRKGRLFGKNYRVYVFPVGHAQLFRKSAISVNPSSLLRRKGT